MNAHLVWEKSALFTVFIFFAFMIDDSKSLFSKQGYLCHVPAQKSLFNPFLVPTFSNLDRSKKCVSSAPQTCFIRSQILEFGMKTLLVPVPKHLFWDEISFSSVPVPKHVFDPKFENLGRQKNTVFLMDETLFLG